MRAQRLFTRTLKENLQQYIEIVSKIRNQPSRNPNLPRLQSLKASGKKRGLESDKDSFVLGSS
jgi:hypothetical protein